ncbi:hypothetical protein HII36_20475 [Nonomuraea sp. NN258]|uniref:hypothetical protein n=1 Tax=Nonomuraea antri TaxID=2730852 RepID=UPI001569D169|nr:hypothetical protein [Nonomuraea antri]NRQ34208.1 hypothetical protein [Nonomuraea antri]
MTTEQESGRRTPVRGAVPETVLTAEPAAGRATSTPGAGAKGTPITRSKGVPKARAGVRRPGVTHQSKPRPGLADDGPIGAGARAAAGRTSAPEVERPGTDRARPGADRARPGVPRVRRPAASSRPESARRTPRRRQRAPFVLLVVGLLCGGLVSLLLLNTMLAQDAITEAKLREQIAQSRQEADSLKREYEKNTQAGELAKHAPALQQRPDWGSVNPLSGNGDASTRVDSRP